MDELEASMNRSSRYTNPFLSNEDENLLNFWNNPELETSIFSNEYNNNNHEDVVFRKSCNVPSHLFEKTTGFYVDKHSVECELPDIIVCYKERDFNVKDVCIDEGVPNASTNSIDNDNKEILCNSAPLNGEHVKMNEGTLDNELLNHEWLRPSTMTDSYLDVELKSSVRSSANIYGPGVLKNTYDEELNSSNNSQEDVSSEELASNSMFPLEPDWSLTSLDFTESSNSFAHVVDQQPLQNSEEEFLERAVVGSEIAKPCRSSQMKYVVNESEIEGSVTFHFDTGKTATSSDPSGAMRPESIYGHPLETEIAFNNQDASSGKVANQQVRHVEGELSFSMAGVISELISCSRPMPFSGGISNRSDSSATSTRSFAFPT
uniref:uncharacterized protein LOC122610781 n=1 Tax=Erigeron canadensis TaxID=72917 RepID=UPI001CB9B851|nr:uncharacterized protein LOC122610781 [Erigeron canadensis]